MYSANVVALGLAALKGTETEQRICVLLYDDNFQVISSFELNQLASLTYHEGSIAGELDITDKIIEHLQTIVSKPVDYSPLTIEKALVVAKHVLIFGATKVIHPIKSVLGRHISQLQEYNTALLAQQQTGATGFIMRLKGGTVDKGGPVRQLSHAISRLLQDDRVLLFERNTQADPNSLVPIGSRKEVSFVSDDARLRYLKKKMEHEKLMQQRSNLAKANDGFGAGYMSRDGKTVVGAAHGIDEMIKQAQREESKFTDGRKKTPAIDVDELRQYAYEFEQQFGGNSNQQQQEQAEVDLLAIDSSTQQTNQYNTPNIFSPQVDLLDFGSTTSTGSVPSVSTPASVDIFGLSDSYPTSSQGVGYSQPGMPSNLLDMTSTTADNGSITGLGINSTTSSNMNNNYIDPFLSPTPPSTVTANPGHSVMSSFEDKFAAHNIMGQASTASTTPLAPNLNHSTTFPSSSYDAVSGSNGLSSYDAAGGSFAGNGLSILNSPSGPSRNIYHSTSSMGAVSDPFSGIGGISSPPMMTSSQPPMMQYSAPTTNVMTASPSPMMQYTAPTTNLSSIQVSRVNVGSGVKDDDDLAAGFVMGGTVGSGLEPLGTAPCAPPPPPPPPSYW